MMGVSTKSRRKLIVDGRSYVWYVKEDDDSPDYVLHVLSDDKQFIVQFHLGQHNETCHLTVIGSDFKRVIGTGSSWRRFRCPEWRSDNSAITPKNVRSLIEWCQLSSAVITEVDCYGKALPLEGCCTACGVKLGGMVPINSNCCHQCGQLIAERTS
jgi:hypothetical protein